MILEIFMFFTAIAIVLILTSYFIGNQFVWMRLIAYTMLFVLGTGFINGALVYQTSTVEEVVNTTTTITPQYSAYNDHTLAFMYLIAGAFGFVLSLFDYRNYQKEKEENE